MAKQIQEALAIVRRKQVEALTGLSRSTIYDRLNPKSPRYDPAFPQPVSLGARAIGFVLGEVEAWLAARIELSRGTK